MTTAQHTEDCDAEFGCDEKCTTPIHPDDAALWCGCCGNEIPPKAASMLWCGRCAGHVMRRSTYEHRHIPVWERTYFARTGQDCPFQVKP